MVITWVKNFTAKSFSNLIFILGSLLAFLEQKVLPFKSWDEFLFDFFFKENIPCILLFCVQVDIAVKKTKNNQLDSIFQLQISLESYFPAHKG